MIQVEMIKTGVMEIGTRLTLSSIRQSLARLLVAGNLLVLSACAITPTSIVQPDRTTKPAVPTNVSYNSGGIYSPATFRPMLEDRRARLVGDSITINLVENTSATKSNGASATKDGSVASGISASLGSPVPRATFGATSATSYEDKAAANSSNVFSGSITVTVLDVLPNGYMVVAGEKQVGLDKGTEFVRFSGVVNPDSVAAGNVVPSTKVSDARIEYRTNSKIDAAQVASILTRFFLSLAPL